MDAELAKLMQIVACFCLQAQKSQIQRTSPVVCPVTINQDFENPSTDKPATATSNIVGIKARSKPQASEKDWNQKG